MGRLVGLLGQGFIVKFTGLVRVQGQVELIFPAKLKARLGQGVVPQLGRRMPLGQVGGVSGDLVGDDAIFHIVLARQSQVFLGGDIAQHGRAVPTNHGRAYGRGDVIVAGGDVRRQRPQGVKRRLSATLQLLLHVLLDQLHRHMAGAFYHHLHIVLPGHAGQLPQGLQFRELRRVVGVGDGTGAQAVAQGKRHIVGAHDLADLLKMGVEKVFPMMGQTPLRQDGAAAGDDAGGPLRRQRDVRQPRPRVNGEIIHSLLGLLDQGVPVKFPTQLFRLAVDLLQGLVDRHRADRHGGVPDDPLPGLMDVLAGGQVHDRVRAPAYGPGHLFHFIGDGRGDGRVADVGVDLDQEIPPYDHRLRLWVIDVGGDDGPARRHLGANELRGDRIGEAGPESHPRVPFQQPLVPALIQALVFTDGDELHFGRDQALPGVAHLRRVASVLRPARGAPAGKAQAVQTLVLQAPAAVGRAGGIEPLRVAPLPYPALPEARQTRMDIHRRGGVRVGAGGVIHGERRVLFRPEGRWRVGAGDLPHRHPEVAAGTLGVDLPGTGKRLDHPVIDPDFIAAECVKDCAHSSSPVWPRAGVAARLSALFQRRAPARL